MEFYKLDIHRSEFNDAGFYSFEPRGQRSLGEFPTCPNCSANIGIRPWLPPFEIRLSGTTSGDVIAGTGRSFLVSPRFVAALTFLICTTSDQMPLTADDLTRDGMVDGFSHIRALIFAFSLDDATPLTSLLQSLVDRSDYDLRRRGCPCRIDAVCIRHSRWPTAFHPLPSTSTLTRRTAFGFNALSKLPTSISPSNSWMMRQWTSICDHP